MFPREIWYNPVWCLYDNTSGNIILKHPWRKGLDVLCPYCGKVLRVADYKAICCNQEFRISHHEISQIKPIGTHQRKTGRGWASIRPYNSVGRKDS